MLAWVTKWINARMHERKHSWMNHYWTWFGEMFTPPHSRIIDVSFFKILSDACENMCHEMKFRFVHTCSVTQFFIQKQLQLSDTSTLPPSRPIRLMWVFNMLMNEPVCWIVQNLNKMIGVCGMTTMIVN